MENEGNSSENTTTDQEEEEPEDQERKPDSETEAPGKQINKLKTTYKIKKKENNR